MEEIIGGFIVLLIGIFIGAFGKVVILDIKDIIGSIKESNKLWKEMWNLW